jgi:hypothetical protein
MNPQNLLKGQVLEGLLSTLFKRANYKVVPLGVEHQFPDIDALTVEEYKDQLPESLRMLPDLMVYRWDTGKPKVFFIEAKYRTELTQSNLSNLRKSLERQYKRWSEIYCVLALANPPNTYREEKDYHHRHLKVIDLRDLDTYPDNPKDFWNKAVAITKVFPEFESFMQVNPLVEELGIEYAQSLEPLLDDSVKIIKALGSIIPRQ